MVYKIKSRNFDTAVTIRMIRGPGISKHENNVALSIKVKWTDFEVQSV